MASCAGAWEEQGVPVKRLSNIRSALDLIDQWGTLEGMGSRDLRQEYEKLGLPPEAAAPKVLELLPRLRLARLWGALPLSELQKECRKLGALTSGGEHSGMAQRLALASWGPSAAPSSGDSPRQGRPSQPAPTSKVLQDIAKHFVTMELASDANVGDVKKAYRRLALQFHPDKNQGKDQDEVARKFREVTTAYEALLDFMKEKP